ncbi:MAG: SPOR domain-containing protein [Crocinitomicaceae bacterium]|nr:SPOR domain-containing protein [Crocinitomicaceae bacterium]MBK6953147.1 SPOR domain-containing protein [Crocinitomicaceae bacterium]
MQLEGHISNLLKHHNCVIVPEFGGFIANYESAWINRQRALIFPPYKQILFNGNLTQNDGLLANELVIKTAVSYSEALAKISVQVKDWRKKLEEGHRIELEEIGFLFLQNNQVVFEQNREVNLLLQAYGLKQVSFVDFAIKEVQEKTVELKPIVEQPVLKVVEKDRAKVNKDSVKADRLVVKTDSQKTVKAKEEIPVIALNTDEEIEAVEVSQEDPKVIPLNREKKKSRNYKYAVAAAVILPVMFYTYWIPMKTDFLNTGKIQMTDFNPFNNQAGSVYQKRESNFNLDLTTDWKSWEELTASLPENVAVYNYELNDETYVSVRVKDDSLVINNSGVFVAEGSFNLIAGCFSVESNATNFVSELNSKGYSAGIVDQKNGLYRVSAGSFRSESDAESALDKFKNDGFSGWILKP